MDGIDLIVCVLLLLIAFGIGLMVWFVSGILLVGGFDGLVDLGFVV